MKDHFEESHKPFYKRYAEQIMREHPAHHVLVYGRPGTGKGTLAEALTKYGYIHVGVGALIRKHLREHTALGQRFAEELKDQLIMPDGLAREMVLPELRHVIDREQVPFVLEGYPNTQGQYDDFVKFLQEASVPLVVVWLDIPKDIALERLVNRKSCSKCHRSYAPHQQKCTDCHIALTIRPDDTAELALERQHLYDRKWAPLVLKLKAIFRFLHIKGGDSGRVS